ncbi:hypothetical protein BKA62DRAFT_716751 [Auriculariales sp. MPI-PUGE-AT-0066]|nr:hypothetical protein BKA62DRAFT_716751 [Auriculariales sp. MPI-PUGE-AT-0066]
MSGEEHAERPRIIALPLEVLALIFEEAARSSILTNPAYVCDLMLISSAARSWITPIAYFTFVITLGNSHRALNQLRAMLNNEDDRRRPYVRFLIIASGSSVRRLRLINVPNNWTIIAANSDLGTCAKGVSRPRTIRFRISVRGNANSSGTELIRFTLQQRIGSRIHIRCCSDRLYGWLFTVDDRLCDSPGAQTIIYYHHDASYYPLNQRITLILEQIPQASVILLVDHDRDSVGWEERVIKSLRDELCEQPRSHRMRIRWNLASALLLSRSTITEWVKRLRDLQDLWPNGREIR